MSRSTTKLALAAGIAFAVAAGGAVAADAHGLHGTAGTVLYPALASAARSGTSDADEHFIGRALRSGSAVQSTREADAIDARVRATRVNIGDSVNVQAPVTSAPAIEGNQLDAGTRSAVVEVAETPADDGPVAVQPTSETLTLDRDARQLYILGFAEQPVASYRGGVDSLSAVPRTPDGRLQVHSGEAVGYAGFLESRQVEREQAMGRLLGREVAALHRMQHAFNGIIVELSPSEATELSAMRDISLMEPYREDPLDTDTGPLHINADAVWMSGSGFPGSLPVQGEGMVLGIIDTGVNAGSPSFAATDMDGYTHVNPLGDDNYLGTCQPGEIDEGRCNAKLIGGYEFVCEFTPAACAAPNYEVPGFRDDNGHGSHVGSTVAGNRRVANFLGNEVEISGVAPRANLVFFDACYTTSTGQGSCPNTATLASINQAVADGVVHGLSYSIGGGGSPWTEAISAAFLAATDAGIYVSASAGNSGPGAGTLGHRQPWVHTIASAQHGRGAFVFQMHVTGAPAGVSPVDLVPGANGVSQVGDIPNTTPLVVSPGIDSGDDGCAAFAAGTFAGAVAMIRRGTCAFSDKVNNAEAAGAIAVVIANNQPGTTSPSVPGTAIPAYLATEVAANAVRDFVAANPGATAGIPQGASILANTPDQLAASSSRGPTQFDLIKPDATAPGVLVLAVDAGPEPEGFESLLGLKSGTSMAQPHNLGAAALLRQMNPDWTVPEVKSALMMTASQTVLLEDGVTPANAFAGGTGSIRVDQAARAGLVLHETTQNFEDANPAADGQPSTLNLASMADADCVGSCSFSRTFRATSTPQPRGWARGGASGTYDVTLEGLDGTLSHSTFTVFPGQFITLDVEIDSGSLPIGVFSFGQMVLTPLDTSRPTLRLPIAVSVPPPAIDIDPPSVSFTLDAGDSDSASVEVGNIGGGILDFQISAGDVVVALSDQQRLGVNTGARSGIWNDGASASFLTDDFVVGSDALLTRIRGEGFTQGAPIGTGASEIVFEIYADDGGVPAGDPFGITGDVEPVWSHSSAPNGAGMSTTDNIITLDLAAAGLTAELDPGAYWLLVYSVTATVTDNWVWFYSGAAQQGQRPHVLTGAGWAPSTAAFDSVTMLVEGEVSCGASWITSVTPSMGSVPSGESADVSITVDTAGLTPGTYSAVICVGSNAANLPQAVIPVALTVN